MSMDGKIAIVTGAGQGIGRAIALTLSQKGANLVVSDINSETAAKVAKEIESAGGKAISVMTDVSKVDEIKQLVIKTVQKFGTVDILVNNAGILHSTQIEDITEEEWDRMMAVNLKSVFFTSQQVLPYMKAKKSGRIINISSLAGRMGGYTNGVGYSASKAGIIGLTMAFARRVAEYNITVNAVAPGTTETDIIKQISTQNLEILKQTIPMKRLGKPENIAEVVAFLASDASNFITGAVIDVNGGIFMG
jgi:NAD(P)-dependent dehydrogenase (short-subunit alcohol dehydrogenase family)